MKRERFWEASSLGSYEEQAAHGQLQLTALALCTGSPHTKASRLRPVMLDVPNYIACIGFLLLLLVSWPRKAFFLYIVKCSKFQMIFELIRTLFLHRLRNPPLPSYVHSLCHLESLFMHAVNYGSKFVFAATPEAFKIIVCLCPGRWCLLCCYKLGIRVPVSGPAVVDPLVSSLVSATLSVAFSLVE